MIVQTALLAALGIPQAVSAFGGLGLGHSKRSSSLSGAKPMSSSEIDRVLADSNSKVFKEYVELPIDHFAECSDTFNNRYFVTEEFYEPGGPIFIYDVGEENAGYLVQDFKANTSFTRTLQQFKGMGIGWEHRYWGDSVPYDDRTNVTYLTVEQALADLPAMAANFSRPNFPSVDLTPKSTPWIFIGGSYPGTRAAYSRIQYPDTFYAVWAASAPVQMQTDTFTYWRETYKSMRAYGYTACVDDLRVANEQVDKLLDDPTTSADIKTRMLGEKFANISNYAFAKKIVTWWYGWNPTLDDTIIGAFCDLMQIDPRDNSTAPDCGWAPTKGKEWVLEHMIYSWNHKLDGFTGAESDDAALETGLVTRAEGEDYTSNQLWDYLVCNQCGWFHASDPSIDHFILSHYNISAIQQHCRDVFPEISGRPAKAMHKLNKQFHGWNARPSNTFWTADEWDAWRQLSPLTDEPDAPKVKPSIKIPKCNVKPTGKELFGYTLPGQDHADELRELDISHMVQDVFNDALEEWLPCFEKNEARTHKSPPKCPTKDS